MQYDNFKEDTLFQASNARQTLRVNVCFLARLQCIYHCNTDSKSEIKDCKKYISSPDGLILIIPLLLTVRSNATIK